MVFWISLLGGLGLGIIVCPLLIWFYLLMRNAKERRMIKRLMRENKFLTPIDPKDYDVEAWKNKPYGNIDIDAQKPILDNLNARIFKKSVESSDDAFMSRIMDYVYQARKQGYTDEQIKEEFKKKSYTEDLIDKIFEHATKT